MSTKMSFREFAETFFKKDDIPFTDYQQALINEMDKAHSKGERFILHYPRRPGKNSFRQMLEEYKKYTREDSVDLDVDLMKEDGLYRNLKKFFKRGDFTAVRVHSVWENRVGKYYTIYHEIGGAYAHIPEKYIIKK